MDEDEAYRTFLLFRWPDTDGKPTCRYCGVVDCYEVRGRKFKCSGCRREFSVTSGTVFAFRKLPFKKMIMAIWLSVNAAKGLAALHLSRLIGTQFKTAWVLSMKLREAVGYRREGMVLGGEVQMDGKYTGGHVKKENRAEDRVDRRLKRYQNMKRICVLALREKNGRGRERTFTRVVQEENGKAAFATVTHHVDRKAVVVTDEHPSYADIVAKNEHRQVSHSEAYSAEDGVNTNHVESFFSRVQRSYVGVHHRFSLKYFDWYAADLAWREDSRRRGNRWLTAAILLVAMQSPTSRNLCGYWQGNSPPEPDFADVTEPFKPI
nr:IS1595 family transposase [uncultured Aureimonas sp.]